VEKYFFISGKSTGKRRVNYHKNSKRQTTIRKSKPVERHLDVIITTPDNKERRYWIGEIAIKEGHHAEYVLDKDKLNSESGRASALTALALLAENDNEKFVIGTGLPISDHKTTLKSDYEKFRGKYKVTFGSGPWSGIEKNIEILATRPYQQGMGIFFDQVFIDDFENPAEDEAHPLLNDGFFGIIDVGSRTTNFHLVEDGEVVINSSDSIEHGINDIHKPLLEYVTSKNLKVPAGRDEKLITMDEFGGYDLLKIRTEATQALAYHIETKANALWRDVEGFLEKIYVAGGAGQYIFDYLKLNKPKELVKHPQFSNAYGFLKAVTAATLMGKVVDQNGEPIQVTTSD